MKRNGRPADLAQRLFDGDFILSHSGADMTERPVTRRETLRIAVVHEGAGPVVTDFGGWGFLGSLR